MPTLPNSDAVVASGPVLLSLGRGANAGVAQISLNRPEASNGLSLELLKALHEVVMRCHGNPSVRVVLLTGEGKNFCAGGDVKEFAERGEALADHLRQATTYLHVISSALIHLQAPVIAAVQGHAAGGGGLGLVCCSDLVIAGESSKYLAGATRVGMAPDAGLSVTLARLIGFRKAMELLLRNPIVTAAQALELGLVNQVVPDASLFETALTVAQELAQAAPKALAATKRLMWSGLGLGIDAAMPEESRTVSELSGTADVREGLAAVIERRKPTFQGR